MKHSLHHRHNKRGTWLQDLSLHRGLWENSPLPPRSLTSVNTFLMTLLDSNTVTGHIKWNIIHFINYSNFKTQTGGL